MNKIPLWSISIIVSLLYGCQYPKGDSRYLFQHPETGLYGFIDEEGSIAIPPVFTNAYRFHEGRAIVEVSSDHACQDLKNNVRVIDTRGDVIVYAPSKESDISDFSNSKDGTIVYNGFSCSVVYDKNGRIISFFDTERSLIDEVEWCNGYMVCILSGENRSLRTVDGIEIVPFLPIYITPRFGSMTLICLNGRSSLPEAGLLGTFLYGGVWAYIDNRGVCVFSWEDECETNVSNSSMRTLSFLDPKGVGIIRRIRSSIFNSSLFPVYDSGAALYGYIDRSGKMKTAYRYSHATDFRRGRGIASIDLIKPTDTPPLGQLRRSVLIDAHGREISPREDIVSIEFAGEGVFRFRTHSSLVGACDSDGKILFMDIGDREWGCFSSGLAVFDSGGRKGYLDARGRTVVKARFDYAWPFSGPLALVNVGGVPSASEEEGFRDHIVGGEWSYIDVQGRAVFTWHDPVE